MAALRTCTRCHRPTRRPDLCVHCQGVAGQRWTLCGHPPRPAFLTRAYLRRLQRRAAKGVPLFGGEP